jgi:hypothetical protein
MQKMLRLLRAIGTLIILLMADIASAQAAVPDVVSETLFSRAEVVFVTVLALILCVVVHYEALSFLTTRLRHIQLRPRPRILVLIFAILGTHVLEIWIFGGAYYWLTMTVGHGALLANHAMGLLDSVYFSAVSFTTLGLGDIVPSGAIRFLVGTEALTGFVLITWSASFTFMEMEKFWRA